MGVMAAATDSVGYVIALTSDVSTIVGRQLGCIGEDSADFVECQAA